MSPALSADGVIAAARACRFTLVGLAPAAPLDPAPFLHWLEAGYGTGLAAMHRRVTERLDPRNIVPSARTVIALGIPYGAGQETANQPEPAVNHFPASTKGSARTSPETHGRFTFAHPHTINAP